MTREAVARQLYIWSRCDQGELVLVAAHRWDSDKVDTADREIAYSRADVIAPDLGYTA
jgi:hypothetical protein